MENQTNFNGLQFNLPKNQSNVIKVIGVGGGGGNAVNHMYSKAIEGVDFVICNTDAQALSNSPIPTKIQLGAMLTEGLGAGANPEIGKQSALESLQVLENMLDNKTKMIFITVGMGGGTGTGAAPVIAKMAKDKGILTIAIVTTPFGFEGKVRNDQAQDGINKLREQVDSIIVINNNKLREVYGNLGYKTGFSKADEVLSTAAIGIAKVITMHYMQNIDFRDARTVLTNSGSAIMGSAIGEGANRAQDAITKALDSPLLNDNKIIGAKNVLLLIVSGNTEITIDEIGEINDFIRSEAKADVNIIMGVGDDLTLGNTVAVTIIATGFNKEVQSKISVVETKKVIFDLDDTAKKETKFTFDKADVKEDPIIEKPKAESPKILHQLIEEKVASKKPLNLFDIDVDFEFIQKKTIVIDDVDAIKTKGFLGDSFSEELSQSETEITTDNDLEISIVDESEFDIIPTTQLIKEIDVVYNEVVTEDVESLLDLEHEFEITSVISEIEVIDMEIVAPPKEILEDQMSFAFELPLDVTPKKEPIKEPTIKADLEEAKQINVIDTEIVSENKVFKLDDYLELEKTLSDASATKVEEEIADETLKFTAKTVTTKEQNVEVVDTKDVDPLNSTIKELANRASDRRIKMKDFNYKFTNKAKKNIDELEKQPAYKRNNVALDDTSDSSETSRISLNVDGKDLNFRSNNSFLHDNVD
ncbi:MAG: cell division protein FtsZ [Flavobacteriaceae bacterium]